MWHRIGAVCYVIWGLLHVNAAYMQYQFGSSFETGMAQGRLIQNSWHLLLFGVVAIIIGVLRNWKNSRAGYWINVINLSVVDIGFILFVLLPYLSIMSPAILGPAFWVLAVLFSTLGYLKEETTP
jgi:hypothetical protein